MAEYLMLAALVIGAFLVGTSTRSRWRGTTFRWVQLGFGVLFVALGLLLATGFQL